MTLEEDPTIRMESEKPAPVAAVAAPLRTARPLLALLFAAILLLSIGALWLGLSSHWQALSTNAVFTLPQSEAIRERSAVPSGATPVRTEPDLAELKSRLAAIDTRLAGLEHSANAAQPTTTAPADIGTRLDSIDQRLGTVEVQAARATDRDTVSSLQERVARLEAENSGEKLRQAAATLALANLARAAQEGTSFKPELDALASVAPNDPALNPLQPLAANGVPTFSVLKLRFPEAARTALDADRANSEPAGGFFARAWARLRSLFTAPPVATAKTNPTADRLARAQAALNRGDLPNAVSETKAVTGPAGTAMAPWVKDAEARLSLDRTIAGMNGRIVQALAQQAPQAAPLAPQGLPTIIPPKARESANAGGTLPVQ